MLKIFNNLFWISIKKLSNLQFAIFLLLQIAIFSSFGTIIEQERPRAFYELNYPTNNPVLGFINYKLIFFLQLDHIYQAGWFILLLLLFAASLFSCTLSTQLPSLKLAQIWQFYKNRNVFQRFELSFCINEANLSKLYFQLYSSNYNVIQQGAFLYAYKGLIGKLGPVVVHFSIILILFGSILGNLSGFTTQELVSINNVFHLQNVINSGPFSYIDQKFGGYVKDFKITYNDEGSIDQFYSDLTIFSTFGTSNIDKTIYVNEPLKTNELTIYQTDWSISSIIAQVDNSSTIKLPLKLIPVSSSSRFWISTLDNLFAKNDTKASLFLILEDLTGKFQIFDSNQNILVESEIGEQIFINGHVLQIQEILPSTGLQIKYDPGLPFVYVGFLLLIFSTFLSYTSYSQIWAIKKDGNLYLSGKTNRAIYSFEKDFLKFLEDVV